MKKTTVLLLALTSPLVCTNASPAPEIDVSGFPAEMVEDVVVPVPSEIFGVLDKLGTPDWKGLLREGELQASEDRARTALLLGTVIADGFIAVQAQDRERVKETGRTVLRLAGAIGVRQSVLSRSNSIIDSADKQDWPKVRRELDGALHDVRNAMIELQDEQLAHLVSLGGWLRGTEALTLVVSQNYTRDGAELLHQPALVKYFETRIEGMSPKLRDNPLVARIHSLLAEIRPLVQMDSGLDIPSESVGRIRDITGELVGSITSKGA